MKRQVKKGRLRFEETWVFPKPVNEFLFDLFNVLKIDERTLCHCFSGKSRIGGLKVDIEPKNEPDLVADVTDLPELVGLNSQPNILADPPWKIKYGQRRLFSYSMRDILVPGGYLIINAPWNPWVKGLQLIPPIWKVTQAFNSYRDLVDFWVFKKSDEPVNEDLIEIGKFRMGIFN